MLKIVKLAVLSAAFLLAGSGEAQDSGVQAHSNDPKMKVEMKSTDMKAVKCGEAVVINMHGTLTQMDPPTGGDPETCDILKFTMSNLTSVHKKAFKGMKNVHTISLWGNAIRELHEDTFRETTNLKHLMLGGNKFKTLPANVFRNLKKLTFLDFYAQSDIVSIPLDVLDPLTSLEKLYIADIKLTEDELTLGLLKGSAASIQHLSLGNNRIAKLPGAAFKDMKKLTTLSLAANKITQITKEDLEPMRELTQLGSFLLDKNPLGCCDIDESLPKAIVDGLLAACPSKPCTEGGEVDKDEGEAAQGGEADKEEGEAAQGGEADKEEGEAAQGEKDEL